MANNSTNVALMQAREDKSVNLLDLFKYLLFHWKWYLISLLLFGGYFYYQYSKTQFLYQQSMTVMIKTPANSQSTMRMNRFNSFASQVNVANEILQFNSKELMRRVVDRSQANISYTKRTGLRHNELYKQAPVRVAFLNSDPEQSLSLGVVPVDKKQVQIILSSGTDSEKSYKVRLGEKVHTPLGLIAIYPSENYSPIWYGELIQVTKYPRESMVAQFRGNLKISQTDQDAAVIQLHLEDSSPLRAADVLNTLVQVYNEEAIEDKNRVGINTEKFIKERLNIIENELGLVESDIEKIKTANGGIDVTSAGDMYIADSRQYQTESKGLSTQLRLVNFMKQYLNDPHKTTELIPNNTGLVDMSIESQISTYNSTLLKRNRLLEGSGGGNPVVQELDKTLEAMKQNIIRAVDNTIAGLSIKKNDIRKEASEAKGQAVRIPAKQREILSIERQQKVKEELYIFLLNKREENALNQSMTDDNARIIDPASGSFMPIYPNKYKKLLLGIGCGVAIPTIILLLILMLDTSVHSRKEIEEVVTSPLLAEIPFSKKVLSANERINVRVDGRHDFLSESFRILRTNLGFMAAGGEPQKVITFTSFNAGAGKTFTSVNMAASLAQISKKIVLLDLDLRKGTLSIQLQSKREKGVTHYLADVSFSLDDVIVHDLPAPGIDLIPIGVIAPNPVELLLSKRLDQLISELKKRYDYIIVDNVPMGVVADSSIINRITDVTIFVVRSGKLDRRQLPELERIYQEKKLTNMAILLNGIQKNAYGYRYGYGYGYSYGYGYGYGYGSDDRDHQRFWKKWFK